YMADRAFEESRAIIEKSRQLRTLLLIFSCLYFLTAATALAQQSVITVTGLVRGEGTSSPVSGATVTFLGPTVATTTPKADGSFSIEIPAGIYQINVVANGYVSATKKE